MHKISQLTNSFVPGTVRLLMTLSSSVDLSVLIGEIVLIPSAVFAHMSLSILSPPNSYPHKLLNIK